MSTGLGTLGSVHVQHMNNQQLKVHVMYHSLGPTMPCEAHGKFNRFIYSRTFVETWGGGLFRVQGSLGFSERNWQPLSIWQGLRRGPRDLSVAGADHKISSILPLGFLHYHVLCSRHYLCQPHDPHQHEHHHDISSLPPPVKTPQCTATSVCNIQSLYHRYNDPHSNYATLPRRPTMTRTTTTYPRSLATTTTAATSNTP